MGLLLGNFFEREDSHLNFLEVNSIILLDKISQAPPDFREVAKWLMEEAKATKEGRDTLHGERALVCKVRELGKINSFVGAPLLS